MLVPGYYVTTSARRLEHAFKSAKVRIGASEWLVTDGEVIGRFDQTNTLDWIPLEWTPGKFVHLSEASEESLGNLESVVKPATYASLNARLSRW